MKIALILLFVSFSLIGCDFFRPKDNFTEINYEEDMGICIGVKGNDTNMTEYEKFEAFKKHNCYPLVVVEGVEATKLQLRITDCDALSDDVLNNCNIMTEKNKHRFIFWQPPDLIKCKSNVSELLVWIALTDAAGAIGHGQCLGALFGGQLDVLSQYYDKEPPYLIPDVPGVAITWYGNTPNTMKDSKCGMNAGQDLASEDLPIDELMDFQAIFDYALGMGYQPGLTMLPIPYNWRRMAVNHEVITTLKRSIEYAVTITGKKVIIAAHSFGCLAFLTMMNSFTQEFKDQYIESFYGMACAWGGSSSAVGDYISGERLGWWKIGYPLDVQRPVLTSITSFFDLQPKGIFNVSTPWGKAINERALQEASWNSSNPPQNISFPWIPTPENDCYLSRKDDHLCGLHLYNFFSNPVAITPNGSYMVNESSITTLLDKYMIRTETEIAFKKLVDEGKVSQAEQEKTWGEKKLIPKDRTSLMMEMKQRNGAERLINPGVKMHHVYGGNQPTNTWYNIYSDPRVATNEGKIPSDKEMRVNTHWGDATVNIDNGIVPSLKWSWDFDNGVKNAKPVHMIDYCSNYSQVMFKDSTGKYTANFTNITKNAYNGIMCNNYTHSKLPNDEFVDKLLATILKAGYAGVPTVNLTESDVEMILQTCPHVMAPWTSQQFSELYAYGVNKENTPENKKNFDMPFYNPSTQFIDFMDQFYKQLSQVQQEEEQIITKQ